MLGQGYCGGAGSCCVGFSTAVAVGIIYGGVIELAVHLLLCVHLPRCRDESFKEVLKKEYSMGLDIIYEVGAK